MTRTNISTGGKMEEAYGYSRAVRVGNVIKVAGTCAVEDGKPYAPGDAAEQTRKIFATISAALETAGASLGDIVINRIFLTNIDDSEAVGKVHSEIFDAVRPACTLVGTSALVLPEFLVEIECEAIISEDVHENPGTTH